MKEYWEFVLALHNLQINIFLLINTKILVQKHFHCISTVHLNLILANLRVVIF